MTRKVYTTFILSASITRGVTYAKLTHTARVLGVMASLTLGTVFKFDDRDGVELILGADGAPKEGSVNFKKLVRSIAPVASAASTEGCSLLRGRLTIE